VELLNGDERDGWTIIKFRRELAACEVDNDQEITVSTILTVCILRRFMKLRVAIRSVAMESLQSVPFICFY